MLHSNTYIHKNIHLWISGFLYYQSVIILKHFLVYTSYKVYYQLKSTLIDETTF